MTDPPRPTPAGNTIRCPSCGLWFPFEVQLQVLVRPVPTTEAK